MDALLSGKKEFTFYKAAAQLLAEAKSQTDRIKDKSWYYNEEEKEKLDHFLMQGYIIRLAKAKTWKLLNVA